MITSRKISGSHFPIALAVAAIVLGSMNSVTATIERERVTSPLALDNSTIADGSLQTLETPAPGSPNILGFIAFGGLLVMGGIARGVARGCCCPWLCAESTSEPERTRN